MKHLFVLVAWCAATLTFAQADPWQGMTYQAVARNTNGDPLANQLISLRVNVNYGLSWAYGEAHQVSTNDRGLFAIVLGTGTYEGGTFSSWEDITWTNGNYWLDLFADFTGGTNYQPIGSESLRAVPYAQRARVADVVGDSAWVEQGTVVYNTDKNVGIGTDSPAAKLHVAGDQRVEGNFFLDGAIFQPGWDLSIWPSSFNINETNVGPRLTLEPGGNVGINQQFPNATLDVNGSFKLADGSQGSGKVLASDPNGLAQWISEIPSEPWSGIGLQPDWSALGDPAGYYKDPIGRVHLRGSLQNTLLIPSALDTIFQLPPGYRPSTTVITPCQGYETATNGLLRCLLYISPQGYVFIYPYDTPINGMILLLNAVSYRAEQ